ncbi:MAG: alcohol dehydrogenase catalytic domain-containing protein [Oligoflexales bacterium]|nr:alcohol dehydrogenase catalytic domain-containing protein [Oligoflexales bacterium]
MRAVKFENNKILFAEGLSRPKPAPGEALIKVTYAGICNTDIEITKGYMGFTGILGHEFSGVVKEAFGDGGGLLGKRVVGAINAGCGRCRFCLSLLERHCPDRGTLGIWNKDGCMADYVTLPVKNLVIVPDCISDEEAALVEPFAAAFEILEQVHIKPADKIALLGDGKLGLTTALALSTIPCDLLLVGRHQNKLDIAAAAKVKTILSKDLKMEKAYDIVIDATGSAAGFETALALTKPRGVVVLKSTVAADRPFNLAPVVIDEITIVGSRCGEFAPAVKFLEKGFVSLNPLITKIFDAGDAIEAFEFSKKKEVLKVLLKFDQD